MPRFSPRALLLATVSLVAFQAQAQELAAVETITVYAKGETRQVQTVTTKDMAQSAPGTSPINVISELPGVNYNSADPFGAYEWATRITVRGFSQNQLGFTLDDIPLGDMTYGNWNGLHISRAIIDEMIDRTVLSQGTGALGTASTSNLGGTLQFYSTQPADRFGIGLAQTFGSSDTTRTFVRLDSGLLPGGAKFVIAAVSQDGDKWKAHGAQKYWQVNSKLVYGMERGTLTVLADYSNRREIDYQDLSKEYVAKLGYRWDNYYPDWKSAIQAAQGIYTHGEDQTSDAIDAAYFAGSGLRKDGIGAVTYDTQLTEALSWKTTAYGHQDDGRGLWYTPYTPSPNGSPISLRTSEYTMQRGGVISALSYKTERNTLTGGMWYEHNDFQLARRFYATSLTDPIYSPYNFPVNPFATQWAFTFATDVIQGYVQDTFKVTEALTVNAGFKGTSQETTATLREGDPNRYPAGTINASEPFLPQVGVNWALSENDEIFGDIAKNMRAFQAGGAGYGASPFATTTAGFNAIKGVLKPETSWSYEVGYRFKRTDLQGAITAYHVNFSNRLLSTQSGAGIVGNPSVLTNVGGVTSDGVEIAGSWTFFKHFSWYNAASYDRSTYDNNVTSGGTVVPIKGKTVVDTPEFLYKTKLGYEYGGLFVNLSGDYMSKRYYSYTNDASVAGRFLWNLGTGYAFGEGWAGNHDVNLQLNIYNLFDKRYFSSLGTNGFVASDPLGQAQTLMVGSPRQFFVTLGARF